ncbi:MAG: hypothetical protein Athens101410_729 [Parcubacteria group bacterium Athens1014_10]|nr:MAG: hypothetical protein Athens101410_729 [Parcubacteria group bacterium Athens1014_10]TSD05202.1 MAG: hypothetical protein Athens071412_400 [Parcubacteria group bacterium Athens0714_12]
MKIKKSQNLTKINIANLIAPIISSRSIADILEKEIKGVDAKSINLDFSKVKFISRSAAHALLLLKEKIETKTFNKKEVNFVNANNDIAEMLRIVAANRAFPKDKKFQFNPKKVSINSLLKKAVI